MLKHFFPMAALTSLLLLLLSGCSLKSPEQLYELPEPPEDYKNLQSTITQVQTDLSLEYSSSVEYAAPLSGDNTQTVQLLDLDDDGAQESAVAFFRVANAENPLMIYIFHQQADGQYEVYAVIEGGGSAISSISYENLDDTPGKEFVVHWQMNDDVHLLGTYSVGPDLVHPLLITSYSHCQLMDLDRDGMKELLLLYLDNTTGTSRVDFYDYNPAQNAMVLDTSAELSKGISSITQIQDNFVQDMVPALYVTSTLANGSLVTDILVLGNYGLENITLNPESNISTETLILKEIYGSDINHDSVLELPSLTFLPEYNTPPSTDYWIISWLQYNSDGISHPIFTTYHNDRGGWYLVLPDQWLGQLTISRYENTNLGERSVTFYRWSGRSEERPEAFLTIYRLTGTNRTVRASLGNRFILLEDSTTIYAAEFQGTWDCGLDEESLLANFNLIRTEW